MSMDRCEDCDRFVDTDDDPDCYLDITNKRGTVNTICLCLFCREKRWENQQRELGTNMP